MNAIYLQFQNAEPIPIQIQSSRWWTKGTNMHDCIHAFHHPKPNAISDNSVKPIRCRMSSQISQMFGKASTALRIRSHTHTNGIHFIRTHGMVGALLACGSRTIARYRACIKRKFLFGLNSCQMVWIFGRLWLIYYTLSILACMPCNGRRTRYATNNKIRNKLENHFWISFDAGPSGIRTFINVVRYAIHFKLES